MTFVALYRTLFQVCTSRARLLSFAVVAAIGIGVAVLLRSTYAGDEVERAASFVDWFGLSLVAPIAALVFGTAVLGDPIEDGTYVYLWLRPIGRWQISLAGYLATATVVVPVSLIPTVVGAALLSPDPMLIAAAAVSTSLAAFAYSAVFVLMGQVTQRGLVWGVAYLLIFEQFIARGGKGLGFLSVHSHAVSFLARTVDRRINLDYFSRPTALVVSVLMAAALLGWSVRRQATMDVA